MQRIPTYKEIMTIAIPIMIGSISESISAVVDTAFMGNLGTLALDGMGMTNVCLLMFMMMGWSISRSTQILISQNYGAKKFENIGEVFYNGAIVLIPVGIFISLILYFFSYPLLGIIIHNPAILTISNEISQIRAIGFPLVIMMMLINSFFTGIGKTKVMMYSQGIGAISNIVLNYILVFGKCGMPAYGYRGSAMATVISECIILIILLFALFKTNNFVKDYYLFYHRKVRGFIIREMAKLSYPMLLLHIFSLGSWVYFFSLIEKMGEKELAISMVIKQVFMTIAIPGFSLANTSSTLVGQIVGARNLDMIFPTVGKVVKLNYSVLLTIAILTFIFRTPIIGLFTTDTYVLDHATIPLMVLLSCFIFMPASNTVFNSISALGNTKISLVLESTICIIYLIYLYLSLQVFGTGLIGAWFSESIYWFGLLFMGLFYFTRFNWKKRIVYLDKTE